MEFEKVLLTRQSTRDYTSQQITDKQLEELLIAASKAPLGLPKEGKPHLTVIQDYAILKQIDSLWGEDAMVIYGVPTLIVVSHKNSSMPEIPAMNAACVIDHMAMCATNLGLDNIFLLGAAVAIKTKTDLLQKLNLPDGYFPIACLGVGISKDEITQNKDKKINLTFNKI